MNNPKLGPVQARLTATLSAVAGLLTLLALRFGVDVPAGVAAAAVALVAIAVSAVAPRWARARGILLDAHPAAVTAAGTTLVVWLAPLVGFSLSESEAVILVTGLTAIVGSLTPRSVDPYPVNVGKEWRRATHDEADADVAVEPLVTPPTTRKRRL
jgi:hypothetical protein